LSTVPYILESVTLSELQQAADADEFIAQGAEKIKKITGNKIHLTTVPSGRDIDDSRGRTDTDAPAILVTYAGTGRPYQAGQNCQDDAQHQLTIQIIDDVSHERHSPSMTYHYWSNEIRKKLQANPYRQHLQPEIADIYLVHITQFTPATKTAFHKDNQLKTGLLVTAFAREMRI